MAKNAISEETTFGFCKSEPIKLTDLINKDYPPIKWLIEGYISEESLVVLSGQPSANKTWLALEMARCVASGEDFLSRFKTVQMPVLIVDEESGERRLHDRLNKMGFDSNLPIYFLSLKGFSLGFTSPVVSLIEHIVTHNIGLVIFDSFVRIHQARESDATEIAKVMQRLRTITQVGTAILFIHHSRKSPFSPENAAHDVRGSSDILAGVDCHLALGKQSKTDFVLVHTKSRDAEEQKTINIKMETIDGKITWSYVGEFKKKADKAQLIKSKLQEFLMSVGEQGATKTEIYASLSEFNDKTIKPILDGFIRSGMVKMLSGDKNSKTCVWVGGNGEEGNMDE